MFTILIPFLISMTAFSHLAVQAFQLPADEASGHAQVVEKLPLTVAMTTDRITLAHADRVLAYVPHGLAGYDFQALASALREARLRLPNTPRVVVAVDDPILCADLVLCLDRCREAGFIDVGLAAGTNLDRQP
jgi:biopolymer transport protein ExbD